MQAGIARGRGAAWKGRATPLHLAAQTMTLTKTEPRKLRLSLKTVMDRTRPTKTKVFEIAYGKLKANLTGLTESSSGFTAQAFSEKDLDRLLTKEGVKALGEINLVPVLPPPRSRLYVLCSSRDLTNT